MYLLTIGDSGRETQWLCFDSMEEGRNFLKLLPGYHFSVDNERDEVDEEWLTPHELPDYTEISFQGNLVPLSKYMFHDWDKVYLYFREVPNLSHHNRGLIEGDTLIDAYLIPNLEVEEYIQSREAMYKKVKEILEGRGYIVARAYHGSEDGEAIIFKRPTDERWYFLNHMDPSFVALAKEEHSVLMEWIENYLS